MNAAWCAASFYLIRYGRWYEVTQGKAPTLEVLARIYNGGPSGWRKKSTEAYWKKVRKEIERQKQAK